MRDYDVDVSTCGSKDTAIRLLADSRNMKLISFLSMPDVIPLVEEFFIYSKDTDPQKIKKVTSTVDILPTIVNLFDLNTDGRYYMGNDAFSNNGGYVIFPDFSWYDGTTYWKAGVDAADSEEIIARNRVIQNRMNMSKNALLTNYFAHCELQ